MKSLALPADPVEALVWVQDAVWGGRHIVDGHYYKRCQERRISPRAFYRVIQTARSCNVYTPKNGPLAGGTCWRIVGVDYMEEETSIGVETFVDHLGRRALIVTVF